MARAAATNKDFLRLSYPIYYEVTRFGHCIDTFLDTFYPNQVLSEVLQSLFPEVFIIPLYSTLRGISILELTAPVLSKFNPQLLSGVIRCAIEKLPIFLMVCK